LGDLVRLDPKKYNKTTSEMVGVVSKIDDSEEWRIISVSWAGEREDTPHLPLDLNLVEK
tara:strand:+ start:138 stop:314 length:177 start_codon:yes stop_codon:yes gene_type:complete